jgi:hypothetical protein
MARQISISRLVFVCLRVMEEKGSGSVVGRESIRSLLDPFVLQVERQLLDVDTHILDDGAKDARDDSHKPKGVGTIAAIFSTTAAITIIHNHNIFHFARHVLDGSGWG